MKLWKASYLTYRKYKIQKVLNRKIQNEEENNLYRKKQEKKKKIKQNT